ncbi:unnamed protein product [marine sediment metagenome]|uniref:Uncharacterized protein n=1 Tax=marine sediment metagenome TaxID=412755 RepID=X1H5F7_9ZZZZ
MGRFNVAIFPFYFPAYFYVSVTPISLTVFTFTFPAYFVKEAS